jgi:ribbon-helix-helix protein
VQKDRKRNFVHPVTQRSDTLPSTSTETSPSTSTESATLPATFPSMQSTPRRHRGELAYEKTHRRITHWLENSLDRKLNALAEKEGVSKSTLFDEAVRDLLEKYNAFDL